MKTVMVTGPSSGIGRATAIDLARRGYHLVAAGRSERRVGAVVEAIDADGGSAEFLHLDLSSLDSVRAAAKAHLDTGRELDVLVANAGVGGVMGRTADGFEIHFGVNHLGHFLLTAELQPALAQGARVVVVASEMHRRANGIPFDRVRRRTRSIAGWAEYASSKLANILFARRLAALRPELRTYSVHPGVVATGIFPPVVRPFVRGVTPELGAETVVWCATEPQLDRETGHYYSRRRRWQPSETAQDDGLAAQLWERSAAWCGLTPTYGNH